MGHECSKGIFKISAIRYGIVTSKVYITILSPTNSKAEITRFAIWSWKLIINVLQILKLLVVLLRVKVGGFSKKPAILDRQIVFEDVTII